MNFISILIYFPSLISAISPQIVNDINEDLKNSFMDFPKSIPKTNPESNYIQITIRESIEKWRAIYKRDPPRNYDRWVFYCLKNLVIIDPSYY